MSCIYDEPLEPYYCEADWNCKDCPNWVDEKLKPCPFCGSDKVETETDDEIRWHIFCNDCGAMCGYAISGEEVVKAWNRRAEPLQIVNNGEMTIDMRK